MIRVLHVVAVMDRGGLETMIMNYYRNIDRSKIQFDFLVHRDREGAYDKEIKALGGRIYRVRSFNPVHHGGYLKDLDGFFKQHAREYPIVHSHYNSLGVYALRCAKKYGINTRIAHSHNSSYSLDYKIPLFLYAKSILPKYSTDNFACGLGAGEWLFGKGKEFTIIPNAIDLSRFKHDILYRQEIRKEHSVKPDEVLLGHVGRFNKSKNHQYIIKILGQLRDKGYNAKLLLVGDGDAEAEKVRELVKKMNLEGSVIFAGLQSDVHKYMSAFDVFIFPSIHEGLPVTLVEAQASGLPCLVSNTIPKECRLTSLVQFIPIKDDTINQWIEAIKNVTPEARRNDTEIDDFDIRKQVKILEKFYIERGSDDG